MCCCGKPVVNGEMGYKWQPNDSPSIRPVNRPTLREGETVLLDCPGRCGGVDSHSHHFTVTSSYDLLVKHGGGEERIRISNAKAVFGAIRASTDIGLGEPNAYWILHAIYQAHRSGETYGRDRERGAWSQAAIDKRIKVRRRKNSVRVEIIVPRVIATIVAAVLFVGAAYAGERAVNECKSTRISTTTILVSCNDEREPVISKLDATKTAIVVTCQEVQ